MRNPRLECLQVWLTWTEWWFALIFCCHCWWPFCFPEGHMVAAAAPENTSLFRSGQILASFVQLLFFKHWETLWKYWQRMFPHSSHLIGLSQGSLVQSIKREGRNCYNYLRRINTYAWAVDGPCSQNTKDEDKLNLCRSPGGRNISVCACHVCGSACTHVSVCSGWVCQCV